MSSLLASHNKTCLARDGAAGAAWSRQAAIIYQGSMKGRPRRAFSTNSANELCSMHEGLRTILR